jgi:hypothetical protein
MRFRLALSTRTGSTSGRFDCMASSRLLSLASTMWETVSV